MGTEKRLGVLLLLLSMSVGGCSRGEEGMLSIACGAQFYARPDGYRVLEREYGFKFPPDRIIQMTDGLTYKALDVGAVDVAMGFATDGRIAAFDLVNLIDDRRFFPVYNPAPVVRAEVLEEYPELRDILNKIAPRLDTRTMSELNKRVDVDHREPYKVAEGWLMEEGLIQEVGVPGQSGKGPIVVSSKSFSEQLILGNILKLILEANGFSVKAKLGLAGNLNRSLLLSGEVDVYMEYTGTALLVYLHHEEPITDPTICYESVKREDWEKNRLVWLAPCAFNNTYTLMMTKEKAEALGIRSISDLARYVTLAQRAPRG